MCREARDNPKNSYVKYTILHFPCWPVHGGFAKWHAKITLMMSSDFSEDLLHVFFYWSCGVFRRGDPYHTDNKKTPINYL